MSGRALRRLREQQEAARQNEVEEEEESSEEEAEEPAKSAAFQLMMDDDSESEEDDDGTIAEEEEVEKVEDKAVKEEEPTKERPPAQLKQEEPDEDLDAILSEFQTRDEENQTNKESEISTAASYMQVIVADMDARDLDIDYVMRTNLLGGAEGPEAPASSSRRSRQQTFLFGPPRDGWQKPPHYVGGGIGMTSYDQEPRGLPWPYCMKEDPNNEEPPKDWLDPKHWFTFMYSDTYLRDLEDYRRVQESGDANALAAFVAHHPFVPEALLQLTMLLYLTSQSQEGLLLLRRTLWVYECSSLTGFAPHKRPAYMDYDQNENEIFFTALFRMMQVSSIAGCMRTSLAVSRYLLSLDPLRDPMGCLLIMDYFALSTRTEKHDQFLVDLVDCDKVKLYYKDSEDKEYVGNLLDMPNWAYSYALALYRLYQAEENADLKEKADQALQSAVRKFPSIVEQVLEKNEVDVSGRSFRTDWPSVLPHFRAAATAPPQANDYDPIVQHAATSACETIVKIFMQRSYKLWSGDDVLTWLYDNCALVAAVGQDQELVKANLSPAIIRYGQCDPADYEERFGTLPPEANPLDPAFLGPAMAVDPNRRRLFRGGGVGNAAQRRELEEQMQMEQLQAAMAGGLLLGPANNAIDPDSPMLEVFLRSALPWNHVEGVQPPPRPPQE